MSLNGDFNYLDVIPVKQQSVNWSADDTGAVTLEVINKGFFCLLTQKLFGKPKISYIHLDETGSFVWPLIDGERSVAEIGELLKAQFGESAEPLYERLVKFFTVLENCGFVTRKKPNAE